jgi:hypothetical protein
MQTDAATRTSILLGGDGDVNRTVDRSQEIPEGCCGAMAQDRAFSACEHSCHPTLTMGQREGAEDVDTLMHAEQLSFADADRDRFRAKSRFYELASRHNSVLRSGDLGDPNVWRVTFRVHMDA